MEDDIKTIQSEEEEMNKRLKPAEEQIVKLESLDDLKKTADNLRTISRLLDENLAIKTIHKMEIEGKPEVVVTFPDLQKVEGEVAVKGEVDAKVSFPLIQKIAGTVTALVKFPDVQKIVGTVKAMVEFPEVQKVDVEFPEVQKVSTEFPETQKIAGRVTTDIPIADGAEASTAKANPTRYVPVRLSNGKRFYDLFEKIAGSDGKVAAVLQELVNRDDTGWEVLNINALTNTVTTVKPSGGKFGGYFFYNPNASAAYIQVFNAASGTSVSLGSTTPKMSFALPAGAAANIEMSKGINMSSGIKIACTTTATGSTAPSTGLDLNIYYS